MVLLLLPNHDWTYASSKARQLSCLSAGDQRSNLKSRPIHDLLAMGTCADDLADRRRVFAEETAADVAAIGELDYRLRHSSRDLH